MDGESNLLDDLSSTETMMTLPSFHNTGDYIRDRPRWTEHTLTSLGVAECYCLTVVPHTALFEITETSEGLVALDGHQNGQEHACY